MILFHRETGAKGTEAEAMLQAYRTTKMDSQWEEELANNTMPRCISPIRDPVRHRSPLEACYRKRPGSSPPPVSQPKKVKSVVSVVTPPSNEPDWDRDPVDIQLLGPAEGK